MWLSLYYLSEISCLVGSIWGAHVGKCKCNQWTLDCASCQAVHMPVCPPFQEPGGCEKQHQGLGKQCPPPGQWRAILYGKRSSTSWLRSSCTGLAISVTSVLLAQRDTYLSSSGNSPMPSTVSPGPVLPRQCNLDLYLYRHKLGQVCGKYNERW